MEESWVTDMITELVTDSRDYREKALLLAAQQLISEQNQRIELLEGQLDGTLWSPKNW